MWGLTSKSSASPVLYCMEAGELSEWSLHQCSSLRQFTESKSLVSSWERSKSGKSVSRRFEHTSSSPYWKKWERERNSIVTSWQANIKKTFPLKTISNNILPSWGINEKACGQATISLCREHRICGRYHQYSESSASACSLSKTSLPIMNREL